MATPQGSRLRRFDDVDRLAHRSAGGNHVVDNQAPGPRAARRQHAAFAMVFFFLAVKAVAHAASFVGERNRDGRDERDAFIGRAEQHVEADAGREDGFRVKLRELLERWTVEKRPASKKYGDRRPALVLNSQSEHFFRHHEADEFVSEIVRHEIPASIIDLNAT